MTNSISQSRSLLRSLGIQMRVIGALLMREVITRYGRHNIGFLWLLMEPVIFTLGVVTLWTLMHARGSLQVEVTPFVVTGYSSLLLWRTCSFRGIKAIESNLTLLHHRPVRIIDIFISRMLLEVAGVTASFLFLLLFMYLLGLIAAPKDLPILFLGWFFMAWFSACLGTILGCLSEFSELVERLWHPTSYFLLTISGTFFLVDWLPKSMQSVVLLFPMVHPIEMIRAGYWGVSNKFHYDIGYIFLVCLMMTLTALLLMRHPKIKTIS